MKWLRDQWAKVVVEGVEGGQQGAVSAPVQAKGGGGGDRGAASEQRGQKCSGGAAVRTSELEAEIALSERESLFLVALYLRRSGRPCKGESRQAGP